MGWGGSPSLLTKYNAGASVSRLWNSAYRDPVPIFSLSISMVSLLVGDPAVAEELMVMSPVPALLKFKPPSLDSILKASLSLAST